MNQNQQQEHRQKNEQIQQKKQQKNNQQDNKQVQQQIKEDGQNKKTCQFYIKRKHRLCKFLAIKDSKYCSAHCSDTQQKVECPYQKGMWIDKQKYLKHLEICPKIKNKNEEQLNLWYNKGINLNQQQNINMKVVSIDTIMNVEKQQLQQVIRKIVQFYNASFGNRAASFIETSQPEKIQNLTNDHIQAHLIAEAAYQVGLIKSDIIYLQFGAGKGILSYHLAQKVKKQCGKRSKNVLLQRQSRRNKFDRFMKDNPYFQRYRCDVSDFDVLKLAQTIAHTAALANPKLNQQKQVLELNELQVVGVCKHMCGGALDISLRALLKTKMSGCILASCCHHLCSYDSYLNNKFFQDQNFSSAEIQIVFRISSWGTKSYMIDKSQINMQELSTFSHTNLNTKNKVIVGRMCKRLIDLGRAKFLNCQLMRYCSDQITPQNFVIISNK